MSKEWYMMSRPLYNSGFEGDEFSAFAQDGFLEVLQSGLAEDVEIYEKSLSVTPKVVRAIIQGVTSDTYNNSVVRQFLCAIGTLRAGQYIRARSQTWMINALPDNNGMYEKGIAWQCKYNVRFISPITGDIVSYPVYDLSSTQSGSGETVKPHMTIGASQHLVYIPFNHETICLDSGFRFLLDKNEENPTAYRLAQVDPMSYSCGENDGLIQWAIVETQFDPDTDNRELMVADYFGKSELSKPDIVEGYQLILNCSNRENKVIYGENIAVDICLLKDGAYVEDVPMDVVILDGDDYGSIRDISNSGFTVYALDNREYIGHEITIAVSNKTYDVYSEIILKVGGWY